VAVCTVSRATAVLAQHACAALGCCCPLQSTQRVLATFNAWDLDGNGTLSKTEFSAISQVGTHSTIVTTAAAAMGKLAGVQAVAAAADVPWSLRLTCRSAQPLACLLVPEASWHAQQLHTCCASRCRSARHINTARGVEMQERVSLAVPCLAGCHEQPVHIPGV
jgi:hypothetical protein